MIRARRHFQLSRDLVQRAAGEPDEIERHQFRERNFAHVVSSIDAVALSLTHNSFTMMRTFE